MPKTKGSILVLTNIEYNIEKRKGRVKDEHNG